ncbi:SDR family NAD(P)-dependent oxidoreductase [Streptomyces roseochromogenus]|uniref:2-hydroxycyclohexanecarboxyl-CoA dehydrogenase n=1 Tax=Streptomyces roseochromogenus subsp. oscitans DS 12.976 TaxID=1352936 RepID=V6JXU9_STRRC|nr:SDR family oxidoreductase [Streptomyces roseochromogenus]EST24745.1 2-hydroxycyclohexanecarboxyl-CoA dehydrogenase [Streptomyces roseochromogenus subsp. oscitans DS 12.976]
MLLTDRTAIVYGAGGSIGGAVARAFAREGARVHLVGRTRQTLDTVAKDITAAGGHAETAVVDALDEAAVEEHADRVGTIDVSFNLVSRGDVQGAPLTEMSADDFLRPVLDGTRAGFLTARAAARRMAARGSGVILTLNSGSAHGSPMMGGTGPADAAADALVRNLAMELGPRGVRAVGLWAAGVPETLSGEKLRAVDPNVNIAGILDHLAGLRMTRRNPTLAEITATAVFLASDHAAGITGTFVNVTGGMFPG